MSDRKIFLNDLYSQNRENIALFIKSQIYSKKYSDAEDCVHEVFLVAIKKIETVDIENHPNIKGWLYRIAKNIIKQFNSDYIKSSYGINTEIDMNSIAGAGDFTERIIEDMLYDDIDAKRLTDGIISALSQKERDLFALRREGKSYKEISFVLNISENAVASRYKRMKQKIKKLIKESGSL